MGYRLAGFDVIGIDVEPQPHYPFPFVQADLRDLKPTDLWDLGADAVHASPTCKPFTKGAKQKRTADRHPNLIPTARALLVASGLPYVIENVEDARAHLVNPIMLCGQTFGLGVRRHRLFEAPWWADLLPPHTRHRGRIGDGFHVTVTGNPGGYSRRDRIQHGDKAAWERAMGIDWMTSEELAQAIPPAYTEFIGAALLNHVERRAAA
jgi:DNA (cytosine-5)-methyltransferase 1